MPLLIATTWNKLMEFNLYEESSRLLLALRLASYFERYPLNNREIALGDATHALQNFINNEDPDSREESLFTSALLGTDTVAARPLPTSSSTRCTNKSYCLRCKTIYRELPTYNNSILSHFCNACYRPDMSSLNTTESSFTYYNPMHIVVQDYI